MRHHMSMTASGMIVFGDEGRAILGFGGYSLALVALFDEGELYQGDNEYGYAASARELRQRLHVQGFTDRRARADLRKAVDQFLASMPHEDDLFEISGPRVD